jgi:dipeptidyl aminopeptidase/acylaminoacyl peptidase
MYKPFDFDPSKSYPIIEYVYPGPHTEAVNSSWSYKMDMVDRLAQIGFIVITVGNRGGHPSRSKWYHNYGYGKLRDYGLEDKKYVIEQLAAKHSFIDAQRVGIHGHSGGGFMTAAALLKYPKFFKVGIASAGNHENQIYNRWWGEQHHGVKEVVSAKGDTTFNFSVNTTTDMASRLQGNLLLVTGDIDNNVHPAHTYRLARALIKSNKRFDMFVMPGQRHSYGQFNEYFFWLTADYFSKHLLNENQKNIDIKEIFND